MTTTNTANEPGDSRPSILSIAFSSLALDTIETIQRASIGETLEETLNRILESLFASAESFDHFYGEPRDGRGPSGE